MMDIHGVVDDWHAQEFPNGYVSEQLPGSLPLGARAQDSVDGQMPNLVHAA